MFSSTMLSEKFSLTYIKLNPHLNPCLIGMEYVHFDEYFYLEVKQLCTKYICIYFVCASCPNSSPGWCAGHEQIAAQRHPWRVRHIVHRHRQGHGNHRHPHRDGRGPNRRNDGQRQEHHHCSR